MFFLQMSGFPGSGKSTLSRLIAKSTQEVIIDHDVVKTALLEALNSNMDSKHAGAASYHIEWSLVEFHLSQGHNVILDSPCLYEELVDRGTTLAEKYNANYKYVECVLNDISVLNHRLKNRKRMISQIGPVDMTQDRFQEVIKRSKKPLDIECMEVDTSQPVNDYVDRVLNYINEQ